MRVIDPITITESILTDSNVPENDYPEWSGSITYATGNYVRETAGVHKIYRSLRDANLKNYPPSNTSGLTPWWMEISSTNRWKMFDLAMSSQTENPSSIQVTLTPGDIVTAISLFNVDAAYVNIVMNDPIDGEVYNETIILEATEIVLWETDTTWSSDEVWQGGSWNDLLELFVIRTNLPPYRNATITISIVSSGVNAKCGSLIIGRLKTLGETKYDPTFGIVDYSLNSVDTFGHYVVTQRAFSRRMSCTFMMSTWYHVEVFRFLTQHRAAPLVWILSEEFNTTIVYGFYKDFSIVVPNLALSECNISIEGLT
jgi:hypothetical protein